MSSRGLSGSAKARPALNVNSSYPGRSATSGGRAAGPLGKNALQTLGKPASIVRRMPPPATLPSLKAEHGQDPSLVAQTGGQGWNKSGDNSNDTKSQAAENSSIPSSGALDLRPTWAIKAGISADSAQTIIAQSQLQRKPVATPNSREFPTLAASLAADTKQSTAPVQANSSESPKTQKQTSYEGGQGTYQDDHVIPAVPPPPAIGSNYIGASVRSDVNRKLPDRYYYGGGSQDARASGGRRYDIRQKLAQLSMESKDYSPSTPTEKTSDNGQSMERQTSVPTVPENTSMTSESETLANFQQHPANAPQQVGLKDSAQMRAQEVRSQDVRQYYQTGQPVPPAQPLNELPETAAWNRAAEAGYDYGPHGYRNEVPSPNAQQWHGRGDIGQQKTRGAPPRMTGQHPPQRSRHEYLEEGHPPPLMGQRFGSNANWEEYGNGTQGWDMPISSDNRMPGMSRPRPNVRGDSRANSESESGWYANQQPVAHQRRNDPNGWNYPLGEYDNYHRTAPTSNRSRTTSNSYPEDYDPSGIYYSADNDRRYKTRNAAKPIDEYEYPEEYDRQKYNDYEAHQQPAYRMLKRNDEKSAEYFGNHAADSELVDEDSIALSQLTRLGRSAKPMNFGSLQSESPEIVSSDTFDSSIDQRKTPQSNQQKFNRAPGSGKPQTSTDTSTQQQYSAQKPNNTPPAENVWKKRMEEQQSKQQDDKSAWQNIKQQRKFDYHFPSISDKKSDASESESLVPPTRTGNNKPTVQRHSSANQRAPTKWDEPASTWNDEYSIDTTGIDDDTYEGTRREFYNRQRGQRNQQSDTATARPQKSHESSERRQPVRRKRNEPEDAFSNVGEFHAEDYRIEEVRAPASSANRFENGFEGKSQKDDSKTGNRQNPPRKILNSDERNRQLKPQRASGSRNTWQRQPPQSKITEEGNGETEQTTNAESETQRPQRSSNPRNQRPTQQSSSQSRTQQPANRRNNRPTKGLNSQSGEQAGGKQIKSPARSENGGDEWETASESSDLHGRKTESSKKPPQNRPKAREKTPKETNGTTKSSTPTTEGQSKSETTTQRPSTNPKNVKPASHTYQNKDESVKSKSDNSTKQQQLKLNTNDSKKYGRDHRLKDHQSDHKTVRNGLAGIDINNASGVVVIDQLPFIGQDSTSDNGDFEEVVSKKTKKQRQLQQQQEEERANRERQKLEQRQKQREEKQRKPVKKTSIDGTQPSETSKSNEEEKVVDQLMDQIVKPPSSSLSPLSATDSGVAAISPPQLGLDNDQSSLQTQVVVSIPAAHTVWNSPSPIANPSTTLPDEPELKTTPVAPIARPKQRVDTDGKGKISAQSDMHSKLAAFGSKDPNYTFGYEHSMAACDDQSELKLNMDKIKDFWTAEADSHISDSIFEPSINSTLKNGAISDTSKIGQPVTNSGVDRKTSADRDILHDESGRNRSRSSINQFGSNSQSPLNSSGMLFGNHNHPAYPIGNAHFNPISTYSTLFSDNIFNSSAFGPTHTNSPPVQAPSQPFVGNRSLGSFINPNKIFVTNGTTANDWPTNNADLLNSINSSTPLQIPTAFNSVTTPCFTAPAPPSAKFPLNHPPPPLGMLPHTHDFRFPPPSTNPRANFNQISCRNQPPPNFNQLIQPPPFNNSNRPCPQQQRRPSHNGNNGRQNPTSMQTAPPFFVNQHPWNSGPMKSNGQQSFGLF